MSNYFLNRLLSHFNMNKQDLASRSKPGSFADLKRPSSPAFDEVIKQIEEIKKSGQKVVIYGDYDVDGLTSTAILKTAFDRLKILCGFFVPNRYREGYGLNIERVKEFKEKGYDNIITIDNGITALEAIEFAQSLGMQVIVIDHHEALDILPKCPIFHQSLSGFIDYNCSAASLAYFVASTLLGYDDDYLATLAGIAVFSDVMPLIDNNLVFAKLALQNINKYRYSNLLLLCSDKSQLTYDDFSFQIIPALNAPGRVSKDVLSTNNACRFLLKDGAFNFEKLASDLIAINSSRKEMVKDVISDITKEFSTTHAKAFLVDGLSGLSGLLANRLMPKYKVPILVLMPDEKGDECNYVGSIRSFGQYNADEFIKKERPILLTSGGHKYASGFTVRKIKALQLITDFTSFMEKEAFKPSEPEETIDLTMEDLTFENYAIYESFMPFGQGFPKPEFSLSVARDDISFYEGKNTAYVKSPSGNSKVVYFGDISALKNVAADIVTFKGFLEKETFRGNVTVLLKCQGFSLE